MPFRPGQQSTYGFEDIECTFTHKNGMKLDIYGQGAGSLTFTMSTATSVQDLSADGSVMTSKVQVPNGAVAVECQQTSDTHKWFLKLHNYLMTAEINEWAEISMMMTCKHMKTEHIGQHMSIQKRADKPYQQQGQRVTWTLLAGVLKEEPIGA